MHQNEWSDREVPSTVVLFDVDGTLTPSRKVITEEMRLILAALKKKAVIGFVGGSDLAKQKEQLGNDCIQFFDYAFSENGTTAYKKANLISQESFIDYLGDEKYNQFVNFVLRYLSELVIPKKRGTFIEFRNSMVNISPIGRNCTYEERCEFEALDKVNGIRKKMCADLENAFPEFKLKYSIGGQISIDVFPLGWDKTFCLRHLEKEEFKEIHFFGDMIHPGGNDYEIANDSRVIAHSTKNPEDTMKQLEQLFLSRK